MAEEETFKAFCHISEYGDWGYRNLHRMIAGSRPLVLWSPSSQLLQAKSCQVSPAEFVQFVEAGYVRVVGREEWLTDEGFRNRHRWKEGAPWDRYVDNELLRILSEDANRDPADCRVLVAPPETGAEDATRYTEENPELTRKLAEEFESPRADEMIPPGTLAAVREKAKNREEAVSFLLRDAFNHGGAIALTESDTAVLLERRESRFLRHLTKVHADLVEGTDTYASRERQDETELYRSLNNQLFDLLRTLELVGESSSLTKFLTGAGHRELVAWHRAIAERLALQRPEQIERALELDLRERIAAAAPQTPSGLDLALLAAGVVMSSLGISQGIDFLSVAGLGLDAIAGGKILADLGLVEGGPNWPYMYAFSGGPTVARKDRLARALDI